MPEPIAQWNPARDVWEQGGAATPSLFCGHLPVYSETFPISGTMRNGVVYAHQNSAPATTVSGSSSSPHGAEPPRYFDTPGHHARSTTERHEPGHPTGRTVEPDQRDTLVALTRSSGSGRRTSVPSGRESQRPNTPVDGANTRPGTLTTLPTPDAYQRDRGGAQHPDKRRAGGHTVQLHDVVEKELLSTPRATDDSDSLTAPASHRHVEDGNGTLTETLGYHLFPTPTAAQTGNTPETHLAKKPGRTHVTDLGIIVENDLIATGGQVLPTPRATRDSSNTETASLLPTPKATDGDKGGPNQHGSKGDLTLPSAALLPTPKATDGDFATPSTSGRDPDHTTHLATRVIKGTHNDAGINWGPYAPAIQRHEKLVGRPAPKPTQPSPRTGKPQLSPRFVEWMMCLPDGWVTDPAIWEPLGWSDAKTRVETLRILGNGVVTPQAVAALNDMTNNLDTLEGAA